MSKEGAGEAGKLPEVSPTGEMVRRSRGLTDESFEVAVREFFDGPDCDGGNEFTLALDCARWGREFGQREMAENELCPASTCYRASLIYRLKADRDRLKAALDIAVGALKFMTMPITSPETATVASLLETIANDCACGLAALAEIEETE